MRTAVVAALVAGMCLLGGRAWAGHPNALWDVVNGLCVRDQRLTGRPAPCMRVNLGGGYAVVPDLKHRAQVLLVPTKRIAGIESPALLDPDAANYWQDAWDARRYFQRRAHRTVPRDAIGMAINAVASRSQDQLHIHVDCVRSDVRDILRNHAAGIGFVWRPLGENIRGSRWKIRSLKGEDLGGHDPFKLLARQIPGARAKMGAQTLVVVGAVLEDGSPGFYLLSSADGVGFGEGLLDHACKVFDDL